MLLVRSERVVDLTLAWLRLPLGRGLAISTLLLLGEFIFRIVRATVTTIFSLLLIG